MSKTNAELVQALNDFVMQRVGTVNVLAAEVKSVDKQSQTAIAIHDDLELSVRLSGTIDNDTNGFTLYPAVESLILIAPIEGSETDYYMVLTSQIESLEVIIEGQSWTISKDGITANGGKNGGLVIASELVKQLNIIEQRVDALYSAVQNAPVTPNDGGATFKSAIVSSLSAMQQKTDFSNIQNKKFTH